MHTFRHSDTAFNFNGDFSGDVLITRAGAHIQVPFESIKAFLGEYDRRKQLEAEDDAADRSSDSGREQ